MTQLITNEAVTGTASPRIDTASAAKKAVRINTAVGFPEIVRAAFTRMELSCRPSPVLVIIAAMTPGPLFSASSDFSSASDLGLLQSLAIRALPSTGR